MDPSQLVRVESVNVLLDMKVTLPVQESAEKLIRAVELSALIIPHVEMEDADVMRGMKQTPLDKTVSLLTHALVFPVEPILFVLRALVFATLGMFQGLGYVLLSIHAEESLVGHMQLAVTERVSAMPDTLDETEFVSSLTHAVV